MAIAPDFVVTMIYPMQGNEKAIGLDYRKNERQREAAMTVRREGRLVITGPVDLVQGGRGLILRYPVMARASDGRIDFWGILSGVMDMEKLYKSAGLRNDALPIDVAIRQEKAPDGAAFSVKRRSSKTIRCC